MFQENSTVCVVGLGYIGLPTASILAANGLNVLGCDINVDAVNKINKGEVHILENGLGEMVFSAVKEGRLTAATEPEEANVYLIAVPTPFKENYKPDLKHVKAATESIAKYLTPGCLIILESTSPVGTTELIAQWISELRKDLVISSQTTNCSNASKPIYIAYCPERVLPGFILRELVENDRIIGGIDLISAEKAKMFYQIFVKGEILLTNARTAEMAKLTENSFRDVNIAFANELSVICDSLKINVWDLIDLANHHPRVNILQPGPGVGGHCIAVDPWFIVDAAPLSSRLIRTAREVNDGKPSFVIEKIMNEAQKFKAPLIACLGLSFKANIDDLRESPALFIVHQLAQNNVGTLLIVEPHIQTLPPELMDSCCAIEFTSFEDAVNRADIIVLLVDHKQFALKTQRIVENKIVIDTRGVWSREDVLDYEKISNSSTLSPNEIEVNS